MKEQELNNLLDKAIGTKGNLQIHSYWMNKIFKELLQQIPTTISQLEDSKEYISEKEIEANYVKQDQLSDYMKSDQIQSNYVNFTYHNQDINAKLSDLKKGVINYIKNEFVDLGLPSGLLWATTNIGALVPEDYGLYFAWGETQGYSGTTEEKQFNWSDYKLCNGTSTTLTKYNNKSYYGTVDNLITLELIDDAAYQSDNTCRMPTQNDLIELVANTTNTWETLNGVNGVRFTSKINGNSIFIPAAGYCFNDSVSDVEKYVILWSSSISSLSEYSHVLQLSRYDSINLNNSRNRMVGLPVRAVKEANASSVFDPNNYYTKSEVDAKILELQTLINNYINGTSQGSELDA